MEDAVAGDIYRTQVKLRRLILDERERVSYRPARDLAAHLLLSLGDLTAAWQLGTAWLCAELGVERVDGGFALPVDSIYHPGQSEALREVGGIPSCKGIAVDNCHSGVRAIWGSSRAIAFGDVIEDRRLSISLRRDLKRMGVSSKIAMSLAWRGRPFALLCADRIGGATRRWSGTQIEIFETVGKEVLAPILGASQGFEAAAAAGHGVLTLLTPAEWRVAQLAGRGFSYKEIARQLDRSVHTIDHQLRGIRKKLGLHSHARLVQFVSQKASTTEPA